MPKTMVLSAFASLLTSVAWAAPLAYNRDIRPILSNTCFKCHGPDSVARKSDLRLDLPDEAFRQRDSGAAIVPGDSARSEAWRRIASPDPALRMPPPDSGLALTPQQADLLQRWIEEGATYQPHWSFLPPQRPELPAVARGTWPRNGVDYFILARLEHEGLSPAAEAGRAALIRRVTLDLTGLPPSPVDVAEFVADDSPDAYERLVDRLLDSPRYGERMALWWLDAARYADSHGYSLDLTRDMWRWRDWVIDAFNRNQPFDQFTLEQLAGDLLPGATLEQRIATGFNRNHPMQSEGGVIDEEYRVEYVVDRVDTTAAVWLALTIGCARCHDHKFDPLTQRDFYRFFAFFNNLPETGYVGRNQAPPPLAQVPTPEFTNGLTAREREIIAVQEQLKGEMPPALSSERQEFVWFEDAVPSGAQAFANGDGGGEFTMVSAPGQPVYSGEKAAQRTCKGLGQLGFERAATGLRLGEGDTLFAYVYLDPQDPPREIMLQFHGAGWLHRAYWGENLIDWGRDGTSERLAMGALPKAGEWVRLEVPAADVGLSAGASVSGWAFTQFGGTATWDKAGVVTRTPQGPSPLAEKLAGLQATLEEYRKTVPTVMVMQEMDGSRMAYVLKRGLYDQPAEQVSAGVPASLPPLPADAPANRLGLARWLVDPDNPLTARVAVNRFWQNFFAAGLVKTVEDFGAQGELPSHPELLDWLATEFVRSGWNVKAMQRLLVTSATYRQASAATAEHTLRDPANRLLSRFPRTRLPAETIRDVALTAGGLLMEHLGGESVFPYQPPGLWTEVIYGGLPGFVQDHGEKLYRRSLYTYWKRSVPPPNLQAFDAPTREVCTLSRPRTNTPLQALVLMNDPTFVEAARKMAERVLREGGPTHIERLTCAMRLAAGRAPDGKELFLLEQSYHSLYASFSRDSAAAIELLSAGEAPRDDSRPAAELAAYTAIASALLSLDETITNH